MLVIEIHTTQSRFSAGPSQFPAGLSQFQAGWKTTKSVLALHTFLDPAQSSFCSHLWIFLTLDPS